MSRTRNGADAICAALKDVGVDTVFGVPGTQTVAFYEAMRQAGIHTVTTTHEMAATFMAQAYFRASGRLAAVSVIPGPGFSLALAGLPEASLDSAALLLITGVPAVCPHGRRRAQSIDQATMAGPVVKALIDLTDTAKADETVRQACALALSGEPGPVLVQVAANVFQETIALDESTVKPTQHEDRADADVLREAVEFVASAKRVLFYTGQGAADAAHGLRRAVTALGAIVATTPSGRGILPEVDDRVLPLDATWDVAGFNAVVRECDAIVVLGAAMSENGTIGFGIDFPQERLVRVDVSEAVLATAPAARFSLRASCGEFVAAILQTATEGREQTSDIGFDANSARTMRARLQERRTGGPSDARIAGGEASAFFAALRRGLPTDGCLVLDSGMHQLLARRHFVVTQPRSLLFPADFQSMAFGLPAAIGAKLAQPNRPVTALIGDGGFAMTGLELRTAVALKMPLPLIVFVDGALGLIRLDQLLSHGHAHATTLGRIDYEAMAAAVGCAYASAGTADIEQELAIALRRHGPTLIVVPVGDAPALRRARQKRFFNQAVKFLLGPMIIGALRRLRKRIAS